MKDTPQEINATPRAQFLASLERCANHTDFIATFYESFLSSSDDIRIKFRRTDFDHQNKMLLSSLQLAAEAAAGRPEGLRELRERAETHSRRHLNIEPRFYDSWLSALITTASGFDDQWNDEIEAAWIIILGHVIRHMIRYY